MELGTGTVVRVDSPPIGSHTPRSHKVSVRRYICVQVQARINDKEPGQPAVRLSSLKRDHAAKSWLFEKYIDMHFVDKNPEGDADDDPLDDEDAWERL